MSLTQDLGKEGEKEAVDFLIAEGYIIKERNWRFGHKELDIIAEYKDELHIVEVKARSSDCWQFPNEVVGIKKQKNMISAAEAYTIQKNWDKSVIFDIVYILKTDKGTKIELIPDAFAAYEH